MVIKDFVYGKSKHFFIFTVFVFFMFLSTALFPQNPFIMDQFTADPSARVFEGKVYVYPSHDILANENRGRIGWFCMEDYHVFSSENLTDWTDHGVIISQKTVPWVDTTSYSMWAPDCIYRNGTYYFYFPAGMKDTTSRWGRSFRIGVATSETPYGPFTPMAKPIKNVRGIDPNLFIDKDDQAYLYWSARNIYVAKLKENMLELDSEPLIIDNLPEEGLKEGPFMFERKGIYYLTYPHVENETERLEYAIADNPLGPFKVTGVIMDESPTGCWTNHQSIIEYQDQWYLFYHHNDLSPDFDKNRSIRIDSLFFNEDGTIQKVIPTLRGVGLTKANSNIQVDRYSRISAKSTSVAFLDTSNTFAGWKTVFDTAGSWIQYNGVDFSDRSYKTVTIRAKSDEGATLAIRLDKQNSMDIAVIEVDASADWQTKTVPVIEIAVAVHNIIVFAEDINPVEVDWIRFD